MIADPTATGVTIPEPPTVATSTFDELHAPVGVASVNCKVLVFGKQIECTPAVGELTIAATIGLLFVIVRLLLPVHPVVGLTAVAVYTVVALGETLTTFPLMFPGFQVQL